ncbi:MAG TPA: diacylglycerol kinase family protein [Humibacter sp.]|nr:diacylglycerol kinase family protein [Humibacter sp.]
MSESVASASGTAPDLPSDARPRRVAIVYNPSKGSTKSLRAAVKAGLKAARDAAAASGGAGWSDPLWLETTVDDAGQGPTRHALDAGADLVLAAGGDGTVRAVAAGLRGSGVPLGIVPLGTGNLLARNLGVPLSDVRASVRLALSGDDTSIDVGIAELTREGGEASAHAFLVMAGIGIDAAMIANTNPQLKKRVGWLAYIEGGLRSLNSRKFQIHYQVRGHQRHSAHVTSILAGNCGVLPGNMELMPDASLDDGELDVALLQPRTLFSWLWIWRKVTWENRVLRRTAIGRKIIRFTTSDNAKTLSYLRGASVNVEVADGAEPVELDGDSFGDVTAAHFWADPLALIVRVPRAG